jgi:predicted metal-binding protein
MSTPKKCQPIESKYIAPGYGCCQCQTYNGNQRTHCKHCNHERCDKPDVLRVVVETPNGIAIVPVKSNSKEKN